MRFDLRPAVRELAGLLRFCLVRPPSRMARLVGPAVLLLLPFFALLALLANSSAATGPARGGRDGHVRGPWEEEWGARPATRRPGGSGPG